MQCLDYILDIQIIQIYGHNTYMIVTVDLYDSSGQHVSLPQKLYGQPHYFQILSIFLYDIFASQPTGQHSKTA